MPPTVQQRLTHNRLKMQTRCSRILQQPDWAHFKSKTLKQEIPKAHSGCMPVSQKILVWGIFVVGLLGQPGATLIFQASSSRNHSKKLHCRKRR